MKFVKDKMMTLFCCRPQLCRIEAGENKPRGTIIELCHLAAADTQHEFYVCVYMHYNYNNT